VSLSVVVVSLSVVVVSLSVVVVATVATVATTSSLLLHDVSIDSKVVIDIKKKYFVHILFLS